MMKIFKILFFSLFGFFTLYGNAQSNIKNELILITDRDYCVSGDSVWVKVLFPEKSLNQENIARIQIISKGNNLILSVAKKSSQNWAEAYLPIPDSLSSGIYFITAFTNGQRKQEALELNCKALFVYNRFEDEIPELEIPTEDGKIPSTTFDDIIKITSNKNEFLAREKVSINVDILSNNISNAVIKAALVDPFSSSNGGNFKLEMQGSNQNIPVIAEKNGLLLNGKVSNTQGIAQKGVLVILSIPGDIPYFDYCVSGENGDFHFFLKEAIGKTNILLQTVEDEGKEYIISLEKNFLIQKNILNTTTKILTPWQSEFIQSFLNGVFIDKIFNPSYSLKKNSFTMPLRFSVPFYGTSSTTVIPDEFIDLPDFTEISRELLRGVRYRVRDEESVFRMLNENTGIFFSNEPLRLLNGIPIFKNNLLANLNSTNIKSIDIIPEERIFGDLIFKGILAVNLYDQSNSWAGLQTNLFQFDIDCLQDSKKPDYSPLKISDKNMPDIRSVYLYEILPTSSNSNYHFFLSDLKGEVEICIEGITKNNEVFKTSKIINVR